MTLFLIALGAFVATLFGGFFALRFKDKLHLILGFSAGAVVGVALFDLLPEAIGLISQNHSISFATTFVGLGFIVYMILDRLILFHNHSDNHDCDNVNHNRHNKSVLGAASLAVHSFIDGMAIGLAFQVSAAVGAIVAIAVLVHDFSDGINTVGVIMRTSGSRRRAFSWLLLDAIAPVLGIISTIFFAVSDNTLGIILAIFCGFFLYIGASDLLPESHHEHPVFATTIMTVLGIAVLYGAISLAGL
jgi:ZIP family zinc transporter